MTEQIVWDYTCGNFAVHDTVGRVIQYADNLPHAEKLVAEFTKLGRQGEDRICLSCGCNFKPFQNSCSGCGQSRYYKKATK